MDFFEQGSTQKLNNKLQRTCVLTDVEGLSSLDFRALFLPCSGSFSGAPASKATPVDHGHGEIIKQGIISTDR